MLKKNVAYMGVFVVVSFLGFGIYVKYTQSNPANIFIRNNYSEIIINGMDALYHDRSNDNNIKRNGGVNNDIINVKSEMDSKEYKPKGFGRIRHYVNKENIHIINNKKCSMNITYTVVVSMCFYNKCNRKIIDNHNGYAKTHNYDYFLLKRPLDYFKYEALVGTKQRVPLFIGLMNDHNFEANKNRCDNMTILYHRIIYLDFDALFLHNNINIDTILIHTIPKYTKYNSDISMIMTGDWNLILNAGVMILLRNKLLIEILYMWQTFEKLFQDDDQRCLLAVFSSSISIQNLLQKNKTQLKPLMDEAHNVIFNGGHVTYKEAMKSNKIINKIYQNHCIFIEQSIMNSNIWLLYNDKEIKQNHWIAHYAGQNFKNDLISETLKFINGFTSQNDMYRYIKGYMEQTQLKKYQGKFGGLKFSFPTNKTLLSLLDDREKHFSR